MFKRPLSFLLVAVILLPIAIYLSVWDYYAVNIPKWDDHAFKQFLIDYLQADTLSDKWAALSKQHNEHRVLLTRLFTWWDYAYYDQLNFKHLQFIGNVLFLMVIVLWWRLLKHNHKPLISLLPVAFIWPTLAHWENMYWGMASIQNFGVVTLVLCAIYWANKNDWGYYIAGLLTGGLAAFSSGNGLLVFPIIVCLLFINRAYKRGAIAIGSSLLFIGLYFANFEKVTYNPTSFAGVGQTLKGFFIFLGSFADVLPFKNSQQVCFFFGLVLFFVAATIIYNILVRLLLQKHASHSIERLTDTFCLGVLLFVLGTSLVVVYSRTGFGMETLLTSRYKIYSFVLLITVYLYIVVPIRGSFFHPYVSGITFLTVLYNIFAYHFNLVEAYNLRKYLTTAHFNQTYTDKHLNAFADTSLAAQLVEKPSLFYEKWLPLIPTVTAVNSVGNQEELQAIIPNTTIQVIDKNIVINNTTYKSQRLQDSGLYILLQSPERYYLLPTYRTRNTGRKDLFLRQQYFAPGFLSEVSIGYEGDPLPGEYQVTYILQKGSQVAMVQVPELLHIPVVEKNNHIQTNW